MADAEAGVAGRVGWQRRLPGISGDAAFGWTLSRGFVRLFLSLRSLTLREDEGICGRFGRNRLGSTHIGLLGETR